MWYNETPGETLASGDANELPSERDSRELRATAGATETWHWVAELAESLTAEQLELWWKVGESMRA